MRLTEFRVPYNIVEFGQSGFAVGTTGIGGAMGGKSVTAIELQDSGFVLVTLKGGDQWVFSSAGYGRVEAKAKKEKAA